MKEPEATKNSAFALDAARCILIRAWRIMANSRPCAGVLSLLASFIACSSAPGTTTKDAPSVPPENVPFFYERARPLGIDFEHQNGMSGQFYFPEIVGAGAAFLDYDNDGDLDVYLVQGGPLDERERARAHGPMDRLYRNDLTSLKDGTVTLHFTDVTDESGIRASGYGMGVATGDFDNDGWVDLYVTNFGSNQLWHNEGNGTFAEVTQQGGVDDTRWSISAAFLDFDRDGWLDLYVGNYVEFDFKSHTPCYAPTSARDYCSPKIYKPVPGRLFRNRGDGTFEDVSVRAGITQAYGGALGVVCADLNGDAWPDMYVANDGRPNQMWLNQQDGTFREEALLAGTAVNMDGVAEGSMGVDAADFDGDGDEDLFMTHISEESNTLYENDGQGWFHDRSVATNIASPSQGLTAFGTAWFDYDNDSWLDLFIANGEVKIIPALARRGDPYPLHQPNQLLKNLGNGRFRDVSKQSGPAFRYSGVSRGAAFGDIDNDGDTDILVTNNKGPARLWLNEGGNQNHWLGLRLMLKSGRDALGARVAIERPAGPALWRRVRSDGSFASANDPRVLVGLGTHTKGVSVIRVYWPTGGIEQWTTVPVGRYTTLREGQGNKVSPQ
jgi:hypothetical protein